MNLFNKFKRKIRSNIIKRKLKKSGRNICFGYNYSLIGGEFISIGDDFSAGSFFKLQAWSKYNNELTGFTPQIIIGNNINIMDNCQISCVNEIIIGDGCLFGDNVFITDNFHGKSSEEEVNIVPLERKLYSKGSVKIGKNVWIGRNVCIMPGVEIGNGCVIGANSVVTHSIPAYSIVAGIPAKIIKKIV